MMLHVSEAAHGPKATEKSPVPPSCVITISGHKMRLAMSATQAKRLRRAKLKHVLKSDRGTKIEIDFAKVKDIFPVSQ
ncbi:hypothetical protein C5Y93_04930 [Blastopirellula marina]|uniref:Uncharacterized protein n=1 Tax=Blastopirellula marina TaxID=124 RepID=A0A2S8GSJ1_9BACT|nr:hypothetical protein C5Y93_04930 [Blastopirellula marina]